MVLVGQRLASFFLGAFRPVAFLIALFAIVTAALTFILTQLDNLLYYFVLSDLPGLQLAMGHFVPSNYQPLLYGMISVRLVTMVLVLKAHAVRDILINMDKKPIGFIR